MQYRTLGKTGLSVSEIGYGGGRVRLEHDETALVKMPPLRDGLWS